MKQNSLLVHASPHPLRMASVDFLVPMGSSVTEIIEHIQPRSELRSRVRVFIGGQEIPQNYWGQVRPKVNVVVNIRVLPGKGKKNPLGTILSIAVMIAAPYLGAAYGATVGTALSVSARVGGALVSGIVSMAGSLLVSAIAPPPKPKAQSLSNTNSQDSPALYISGAQNQARPYAPVRRILGFTRVFPDLGGSNYTENIGTDQYVRQLFIWGYGKLQISDLKIGDSLLSSYSDVERQTHDGSNPAIAPTFTLYPSDVFQNDLSIALTSAASWVTQTTAIDAVEIHCDVVFPNGLYLFNDNGNRQARSVVLEFEKSPVGAGTWTNFATKTVTSSSNAAVRETATAYVSKGQYDIRVRRVTADTSDTKIQDDVFWSALRTFQSGQPVKHKGVAADAVRMRATDQLNGSINRYNGICKTVCLDWDYISETWIERPTNNPASLYRLVLQDRANKKPVPDSKIELTKLQEWHDRCRVKGFTFNAQYDFETSIKDVLDDIAAAGRASPHRQDGLYTIVIDQPQSVPRQHITQRNSWGYKYEVQYPDPPHGWRVPFQNKNKDYNNDEIYVYGDGYNKDNATLFEQIEFFGVDDPDQIYKLGREHHATGILQPFRHKFNCDAEILTAQKGDLIRFSHDVALVGLGAARIRGLIIDSGDATKTAGIVIDEDFSMEAGKIYGLRIRLDDNSEIHASLITEPGDTSTLHFTTSILTATGPQIGDLVQFGEFGNETIDLIVKAIEFSSDLTAQVTCVDYAPGIYTASEGEIPAFQSNVSVPAELSRPNSPVVLSVQSDESVMVKNADGSLSGRMIINLRNSNAGAVETTIKFRRTGETQFNDAEVVLSTPTKIVLTGLEDGFTYDFRIFYRRPLIGFMVSNQYSIPAQLNAVTFEGVTADPDNVETFRVSVIGNIAALTWSAVKNIDHSHYEIRFTPLFSGIAWGAAQLVEERVQGTNYTTPLRIGTYLIRAVDISGNYSPDFTATSTAVAALENLNVVEVLTESPAFSGTKTNCFVDAGALQLTNPTLLTGTYEFSTISDLGDVYTCRLTAGIQAAGQGISDSIASWLSLADVTSMSSADPSSWQVILEISTTNDDTTSSPTWSPWKVFTTGDYAFRGIKFRLILKTFDPNVTPIVSELTVSIDMPDRIEADADIVVPIGGLTINFTPPFKVKKAITVTPQDMGSGDKFEITGQSETGFHLEFFNGSGTSISRTADWIAKGYGRSV